MCGFAAGPTGLPALERWVEMISFETIPDSTIAGTRGSLPSLQTSGPGGAPKPWQPFNWPQGGGEGAGPLASVAAGPTEFKPHRQLRR